MSPSNFSNNRYENWRTLFKDHRLPLAFIDLDAFDINVAYVSERVEGTGKTVRLGSKSIRCEPLMRRILEQSNHFQGILTYTVEETAYLARMGHDDFIVAYPTVQENDLALLVELTRAGVRAAVMVDCLEHMTVLSKAGQAAGVQLAACIEIDLAYRPLGERVHLGLRRSPIRTAEQTLELALLAKGLPGVVIDSLMGYEGHIAGVNDALPNQGFKNMVMRRLKQASVAELTARRQRVVRTLQEAGFQLKVVNGGGSGSLMSTLADPAVSEVTVGSGFYAPALFHHFAEVKFQPAAYFALQVVRKPTADMIACHGGGYMASGPSGDDKAPLPVMPVGLRYRPLEGAGEVSTPLILPADPPEINLGDPVFFQHAKAGELCERFNELYLLRGAQIVDVVPTYRGAGQNFL